MYPEKASCQVIVGTQRSHGRLGLQNERLRVWDRVRLGPLYDYLPEAHAGIKLSKQLRHVKTVQK